MKLLLTDDDEIVINSWTISPGAPEFDVEDMQAIPEYNFYLDGDHSSPLDLGETVWREAQNYAEHS